MRKPAKKNKVNAGLLGAIGAALVGAVAGATAMFLSDKDNREKAEKTVKAVVKKGKVEAAKVKRTVATAKKKVVAAKKRI